MQTEFDDQLSFVRKVLGIVSAQLTLTMVVCMCASYYENFGLFCQNIWT